MKTFSFSRLLTALIGILLVAMLSGCHTWLLSRAVQSNEWQSRQVASDEIRGFSQGIDSNSQKGWVFIGENFDYLLTEGGNKIAELLKDSDIDRHKLSVAGSPYFTISKNKKNFRGALNLVYQYTEEDDGQKTLEKLQAKGFNCSANKKQCSISFNSLAGSIHQKKENQDSSKILMFYHPFNVTFYANGSISLARGLYPVTIALDAVTLPLQLIGFFVLFDH